LGAVTGTLLENPASLGGGFGTAPPKAMNRLKLLTPAADAAESAGASEETLRQQALLLELTPVVMQDAQGRVTFWNRSAEAMYGYAREEALGRLGHELLRTQFPEPRGQILARLRTGRQWQGEVTQVRSDGRQIAVASEWIAYLDHAGELEAVIEVNKEITERKEAEAALANTTLRLDGIIASAMDAIISIDARQQILLFNPAAEKMFGVAAGEALGQDLNRFIPQRWREAHTRHVENFGRTGVSARRMGALGVISGLRANGQEFPIEASISQVTIGGEKLFTVILRDITRRQQAEEGLRGAQTELAARAEDLEQVVARRTAQLHESVAELEAFTYSLSHDMRAPLRAINIFTHIVLDEYAAGLQPEVAELLGKVKAAAERMDRLMQEVLAFSRISRQPITLRPVDADRIVHEVIANRFEPKGSAVQIEVASPLLPVIGHETSLTQCLSNLLGNAVKFVAPGTVPHVRIWTELVERSEVRSPKSEGIPKSGDQTQQPGCGFGIASQNVPSQEANGCPVKGVSGETPSLHQSTTPLPQSSIPPSPHDSIPPSPSVRLWVEDNGIGIEPAAHQKIFEMFQRLHVGYEGTGFGLAIVKKAAERMGGRVGVESEPGKGSRFWLELPAVANG
jgi:PAS domain S-box-containing protein